MKIYFDKNNPNCLTFEFKNKKRKNKFFYIAVPPGKNRIDIFDSEGINRFGEMKYETYYLYNFKGLIIITDDKERKVYQKEKIICKTNI